MAEGHQRRGESLLQVLERAVYGSSRSPYRALLRHGGIELGDIAELVDECGVDEALSRLHEAGIGISIDEFKGRIPICRPGLELTVESGDFDNPLLRRHYTAKTSGSRGTGTRIAIDLDLLEQEAAYLLLALQGFGLESAPFAAWRPVPPGLAGMKGMLRRAHLGLPIDAWFSQYRHSGLGSLKYTLLTDYTVAASRLFGSSIPRPRYVPLEQASTVAEWLAARVESGTPAYLDTNWSSAIRVCVAARDRGHGLSGTFFRVGGEPGTPARRAVINEMGARYASHYSIGEVGWIGVACSQRQEPDEVHLMTDKVAVIQPGAGSHWKDRKLLLTTLSKSCPKILLNVDTGDHGVLGQRDCSCPVGRLGLRTTAHTIASHEKLTTEGMSFVGSEIAWLLESALPSRFGGGVDDYQLLEDRRGRLARVGIVIDPAVGVLEEAEVVRTVLELLASLGDGQRMMAEHWRGAQALSLIRRRPFVTIGAKQQHLHVIEHAAQER